MPLLTGTGVGTAGAIAAGAEAKFVVTARDRYGHAISEGGATFLALASGQVGTPSEGKVFRLDSFEDNSDGTYIGIYTPKYSGAFSLVLKRADEQLQGSPFAVTAGTRRYCPTRHSHSLTLAA